MSIVDEGGGASRSTEPAQGTSAATDISLREHLDALARKDERFYAAEIAHVKELADAHRAADQLAVTKALDSARELAEKHNDLIRAGEKKDETYATQNELARIERVQAWMLGAITAVGVTAIANLVKLWLS